MEHLRMFLRWCVNTHPEVVEEYREMLKGAIDELQEMVIEREMEEERNKPPLPEQR